VIGDEVGHKNLGVQTRATTLNGAIELVGLEASPVWITSDFVDQRIDGQGIGSGHHTTIVELIEGLQVGGTHHQAGVNAGPFLYVQKNIFTKKSNFEVQISVIDNLSISIDLSIDYLI